MPFTSASQMRGAFAGAFGPKMKAAAPQWASETANPKAFPDHVKKAQHQQLVNHYIRQGLKPHGPR